MSSGATIDDCAYRFFRGEDIPTLVFYSFVVHAYLFKAGRSGRAVSGVNR